MLPLATEIIFAAQDARFIKDPFFTGSSVNLVGSQRPEMYAGGFSQVFTINKDNQKWAFKVWTREITNNGERYRKIKEHLKKAALPYFIDFEYVEGGLLVNGERLDTLRMEWIEGYSLAEYINKFIDDEAVLKELASKFLKLTQDLHYHFISHGDLQTGNIRITDTGDIKLIDYDSICIPELEGSRDVTRGTFGYQHPSRLSAGYLASIKVDYFSELVIYISILAVAENSLLWGKYQVMKADYRLLFSDYDFLDFEASTIRRDLNFLSKDIRSLVEVLDNYLAAHLNFKPFAID